MHGGVHYYPGVRFVVCDVVKERPHHRYFLVNVLKLLTPPILPLGQVWSAAREYLANINSNVLINAILYDSHMFIPRLMPRKRYLFLKLQPLF